MRLQVIASLLVLTEILYSVMVSAATKDANAVRFAMELEYAIRQFVLYSFGNKTRVKTPSPLVLSPSVN